MSPRRPGIRSVPRRPVQRRTRRPRALAPSGSYVKPKAPDLSDAAAVWQFVDDRRRTTQPSEAQEARRRSREGQQRARKPVESKE